MSKKDFYAIGNVLAAQWAVSNPSQRGAVWCITLSIADKFAQANHLFDRPRFYKLIFGIADPLVARSQCEFRVGVDDLR